MRYVVILFLHLIVTVVRLARPGGLRSVVAESLTMRIQVALLYPKLSKEQEKEPLEQKLKQLEQQQNQQKN